MSRWIHIFAPYLCKHVFCNGNISILLPAASHVWLFVVALTRGIFAHKMGYNELARISTELKFLKAWIYSKTSFESTELRRNWHLSYLRAGIPGGKENALAWVRKMVFLASMQLVAVSIGSTMSENGSDIMQQRGMCTALCFSREQFWACAPGDM